MAWLVDAALVALPVVVAMSLLGRARFDVLADEWRGIGAALGQAMAAAIARGEAPLMLLQSWLAADGPLRPAIRSFLMDAYSVAWPAVAAFVLLGLAYWPLQEAGRHRATVGKRALGLQALDARGAALDVRRAGLRHLAGGFSWLTLNIGHLLAARGPRHQALHDRIAGTRVVWRAGASRRLPIWGWWLIVIASVLPLIIAMRAAAALSAAMQAALGI